MSADSATDAWAVGTSENSRGQSKTLTEHWDGGTWQVVPSPNHSPFGHDVLESVSAISSTDTWAVGYYQAQRGKDNDRPLVLHWDGHTWTYVSSPSGHHYSVLASVSAVGSHDVWAVGELTRAGIPFNHYRPLFEHWDGTSWSIVESAQPRERHTLSAVSAVSSNDVWAAGNNAIFHRGTTWRTVAKVPGSYGLEDLSMDSVTDGWAVGDQLAMHWDGTSWKSVSIDLGYWEAVTAISPTDAWAAGDGLEHWNGTTWTYVAKPPSPVLGMDAEASDDIWAVGGYPGGFIEHWDGTSWTVVQD